MSYGEADKKEIHDAARAVLEREKGAPDRFRVGLVNFSLNEEAPYYNALVSAHQTSPNMLYMDKTVRGFLEISKGSFADIEEA